MGGVELAVMIDKSQCTYKISCIPTKHNQREHSEDRQIHLTSNNIDQLNSIVDVDR